MPSKNSRKIYLKDTFYHVYNRGIDKMDVFREEDDYAVFLNLIKRYLSKKPVLDLKSREYPWLYNDIELLAFCLMPNHFHLLVYQIDENALQKLVKNVCGSYTAFFNKKYQRVGPLFQERFKATIISKDTYLLHISRYIHLNPGNYQEWTYSSYKYYLGMYDAEWLRPKRILELFTNKKEYQAFIDDWRSYKETLSDIKTELADH